MGKAPGDTEDVPAAKEKTGEEKKKGARDSLPGTAAALFCSFWVKAVLLWGADAGRFRSRALIKADLGWFKRGRYIR